MGVFDFLNSGKKARLLAWQNVILSDPTNKLIMTEAQLMATSKRQAENDLRIINDSVSLVSTTVKPDVFFSRLALIGKHTKRLMKLEPYISFSGASPSAAYNNYVNDKPKSIRMFVDRYYSSIREKAEGMKTAKGKANQYQKFYDSLCPYFEQIDAYNKQHIIDLYETATKTGCQADHHTQPSRTRKIGEYEFTIISPHEKEK